jgi:uncharacterized protein YndB with AHSA1/START domain
MLTGESTRTVEASPEAVFAVITDLAELPSWNATMTRVLDRPEHLEPGAQWVVEFHVLGRTWRSRSTCEAIEPQTRRFVYRTQTDDGNPSHATWRWEVDDAGGATTVRVRFELHPKSFWRRLLLARIRVRQLTRQELPASLAALERVSAGTRH